MPEPLGPTFVRVKDKETKHEYSVVESTFDPKLHDRLDKPAVHTDGTALPMKPYVDPKSLSSNTSGGTSASVPSGQKATPDKEEEAR